MPPTPFSHISPEEERKNVIKGRDDMAIAIIAKRITVTIDTVKSMEQKTAADKAAEESLAFRMAKSENSTKDLLQNLKIMR